MLWMAIRCSCNPDSTLAIESEEKFFNSQLLKTNFLCSEAPRRAVGRAQSRFQWIPGPIAPGVKRLCRRADCSPPSSAEIKNELCYTSLLQMPSRRTQEQHYFLVSVLIVPIL